MESNGFCLGGAMVQDRSHGYIIFYGHDGFRVFLYLGFLVYIFFSPDYRRISNESYFLLRFGLKVRLITPWMDNTRFLLVKEIFFICLRPSPIIIIRTSVLGISIFMSNTLFLAIQTVNNHTICPTQ